MFPFQINAILLIYSSNNPDIVLSLFPKKYETAAQLFSTLIMIINDAENSALITGINYILNIYSIQNRKLLFYKRNDISQYYCFNRIILNHLFCFNLKENIKHLAQLKFLIASFG